jgi:hypothetical protein
LDLGRLSVFYLEVVESLVVVQEMLMWRVEESKASLAPAASDIVVAPFCPSSLPFLLPCEPSTKLANSYLRIEQPIHSLAFTSSSYV